MYIKYNSFRLNENLSDAKDFLIKRDLLIKKRDKMIAYLTSKNLKPEQLIDLNIFELSNLCFINYLSTRGFDRQELNDKNDACDNFTKTKKLNKELEISAVEFSKREGASANDKKELKEFIFTKKEIEEAESEAKMSIEKNYEFKQLRDTLIADKAEKSIGFFTRLLFSDISTKKKEFDFNPQNSFKMVMSLYNDLKELGPHIPELPEASDRKKEDGAPVELQDYIAIKDNPLEKLMDDIDLLKSYVKSKKLFINRLSKRFREEFKVASRATKDRVKILTKEFSEFGMSEETGEVDAQENKKLQNKFFEDQAGDTNLDGLLRRATNYIKTLGNKNMSKFLKKLAEVNDRFGEASGVKIIYPGEQEQVKPDILIIEIRSFLVNAYLNTSTAHCIAKWESNWDSYVNDENGNKQYYIYNFGLDPDDDRSIIGVTITPEGKISSAGACQDRDNKAFEHRYHMTLKEYMENKLGIPYSILKPITPEERAERLHKVEASRGIVFPNLPFDTLKGYLDRGADPNYKAGTPLINAVKENKLESVKLLLERGADPNIGQALSYINSTVSPELGWTIAKTLIENDPGANPSTNDNALLINAVKNDKYEEAKYLLYHGADANLKAPIDHAKNIEMIRLLVEHHGRVSTENFTAVIQNYKDLKYLLDHGANPGVDKSKILRIAIEKVADEEQAIQIIDLLLKHGAKITDGNKRVFKDAAKLYKFKVLKYLLDKLKLIDPVIANADWFGTLAFCADNSLEPEQAKTMIRWLENYSGFDLKEYL